MAAVPTNPYAHLKCAFASSRRRVDYGTVEPIPDMKDELVDFLNREVEAISHIQDGFRSYVTAIHSGEYHTFGEKFLEHERTAADETIEQLSQITTDLKAMIVSLETSDAAVEICGPTSLYGYAREWISHYKAVLVECHVFYKINYVLGSDKYKKQISEGASKEMKPFVEDGAALL